MKKGAPGTWQVRARAAQDLENLITAAKLTAKIITTPRADYACRIILDGPQFAQAFSALADSVDYPNFKDCVGKQPDQRGKLHAYHAFWGSMLDFQRRKPDAAAR